MNIKFSICITYFYKRNNIYELLNELNVKKNKDIEILIGNDNSKEYLNLKSQPRVKIFHNNNNPVGEINNIKFLLKKTKGKYISIISDDDLMHHSIFKLIKKLNFKNTNYLFSTTKYKNKFGNNNEFNNMSSEEKIIKFLERKKFFSGTIAAIYTKKFITDTFKNIRIKKYLLDTYLLFKILDSKNIILDYNYGFNNTLTSQISSLKLDQIDFFHDYHEIINIIKKNILLEKFILFSLLEYYSAVHRENKLRINYFYKFLKLNFKIKNLNYIFKFKLLLYGNYYLFKLFLKAVKAF